MALVTTFGLPALRAADGLLAFPGAEGFGRFAKGGRGGDVYHVSTLDDGGPGSPRDAIKTKGRDVPRTVVFDVGGTIKLRKKLTVEGQSGLTLAGQTAPGGGITIRDHSVEFSGCSDVVVRFMRFRLGDETRTSEDVISVGPEGDRPATQPAMDAYDLVLARAGASLRRDAADERVIEGVRNRTNRRIDSQREVGGWPKLAAGVAAADTDRDGMADAWERARGLDPANPCDGNAVAPDGYTNLEHYLNERAEQIDLPP